MDYRKIVDFIYSHLCNQYRKSDTPVKKPSSVFVAVCGCYYSILASVVINPDLSGRRQGFTWEQTVLCEPDRITGLVGLA